MQSSLTIVQTHRCVAGHNSLFHLGMAMPTLSPQAATIPPFPTPTLSRGCKRLLTSDQIPVTHLI